MQGCSKCGSTTHKSAMSFACPEHKCASCQDTLEPNGHNRNHFPRMQTICEECGETGHDANKCPIRPCSACGLRSQKLQTSRLCPERVCTCATAKKSHKVTTTPYCPRAVDAYLPTFPSRKSLFAPMASRNQSLVGTTGLQHKLTLSAYPLMEINSQAAVSNAIQIASTIKSCVT